MISPTIRKAKVQDIPEIQRLYRQLDDHHAELLPEIFQPVAGDARGSDLVQTWIFRDAADYLLAELNGQVVGFIIVPYDEIRVQLGQYLSDPNAHSAS